MTEASEAAAGDERPLLELSGLRVWFPIKKGLLQRTVGQVRAVDGVDLVVRRGTTHALVGESGCGKTTVGRAILRLVEPTEGEIHFQGRDVTKLGLDQLRPLRSKIQMVFQDPMTSLDPRFRVRELVAEGMESFGIGRSQRERTERVQRLFRRVKLDPGQLERFPHEFSGGQRQRIGLARALAVEPDLVICDEAVSALDVSIQAQMLNLLGELRDELGLTYLFITHDLSVVRYLADEVSVMYLGQIVERGPTARVFSDPRHPYTRGLLSAIPSADPEKRSAHARVLGDVPSPASPPSGCRFHTRCPERFERCPKERPELYPVPGGGASRCFLEEESASGS